MKMNSVVHFEMPYEDKQRAADFYKKTFGWEVQMLGPDMGDYVVVHTAETDSENMVKEPGRINGGLYKKSETKNVPTVVIAVDDIYEAMNQVKESGGKMLGGSQGEDKPDEIPGIGLYASFIDTEGNQVAMLQPKSM